MLFIFNFSLQRSRGINRLLVPPPPPQLAPFAKCSFAFNNGSLNAAVCSLFRSVGFQDIEMADAPEGGKKG